MKLRDRIKELRRVEASEILSNPANWRTPPASAARPSSLRERWEKFAGRRAERLAEVAT